MTGRGHFMLWSFCFLYEILETKSYRTLGFIAPALHLEIPNLSRTTDHKNHTLLTDNLTFYFWLKKSFSLIAKTLWMHILAILLKRRLKVTLNSFCRLSVWIAFDVLLGAISPGSIVLWPFMGHSLFDSKHFGQSRLLSGVSQVEDSRELCERLYMAWCQPWFKGDSNSHILNGILAGI